MSNDDKSTLHNLATIATDALHKVEAKVEAVMEEADAELLKGPVHIGPPTDVLGLPVGEFVAEPVVVDQEDKAGEKFGPTGHRLPEEK